MGDQIEKYFTKIKNCILQRDYKPIYERFDKCEGNVLKALLVKEEKEDGDTLLHILAKTFEDEKFEQSLRDRFYFEQIGNQDRDQNQVQQTTSDFIKNEKDTIEQLTKAKIKETETTAIELMRTMIKKNKACAFMKKDGDKNKKYAGETAFHILIAKQRLEAVKSFINCVKECGEEKQLEQLLLTPAKGKDLSDYVRKSQLPLSLAAISLNLELVKVLLDAGAHIAARNSKGRTVFHSIIAYQYHKTQIKKKQSDTENFDKSSTHNNEAIEIIKYLHFKLAEKQWLPPPPKLQTTNFQPPKKHLLYNSNSVEPINVQPATVENSKDDVSSLKADDTKLYSLEHVWKMEDNKQFTALRLAVSCSEVEIAYFILSLEDVYMKIDKKEGVSDIAYWDTSEVDTYHWEQIHKQKIKEQDIEAHHTSKCKRFKQLFTTQKRPESVLDTVSRINRKDSYTLLRHVVLQEVVNKKWKNYQKYFYSWMAFHLLFMIAYSYSASEKTRILRGKLYGLNVDASKTTTPWLKYYVDALLGLSIFYSLLIIFFEVKRWCFLGIPLYPSLIHHNFLHRLSLFLFGASILTDSISFMLGFKEINLIIVSLVFGWWFCVFFLRTIRKISFFTVMILKIFFGDMIRFLAILILQLFGFSLAMHLIFLISEPIPASFEYIFPSIFSMYQLMLGLESIDVLGDARNNWLATIIFIAFVLTTYVLLINSLIAMLSQTCSQISDDRYNEYKRQRLLTMLFIETVIPNSWLFNSRNVPAIKVEQACKYAKTKGEEIQRSIKNTPHSESKENKTFMKVKGIVLNEIIRNAYS